MKTTRARKGDPVTSHAAAEKVTALRASQLRVKNMFVLYGDMHDRQLLTVLHEAEKSAGLKPMSPSGARSRRSELAKPNMDRLDEIAREIAGDGCPPSYTFADLDAEMQAQARRFLLTEGVRSALWDTGKRELVEGRHVIVWGIAR
jgi:hypothetical protein